MDYRNYIATQEKELAELLGSCHSQPAHAKFNRHYKGRRNIMADSIIGYRLKGKHNYEFSFVNFMGSYRVGLTVLSEGSDDSYSDLGDSADDLINNFIESHEEAK